MMRKSSLLNISSVSEDYNVFDDDDCQGTELSDDQVSLYEPEVIDGYITAQVLLPRGDQYKLGTVMKGVWMIMKYLKDGQIIIRY